MKDLENRTVVKVLVHVENHDKVFEITTTFAELRLFIEDIEHHMLSEKYLTGFNGLLVPAHKVVGILAYTLSGDPISIDNLKHGHRCSAGVENRIRL